MEGTFTSVGMEVKELQAWADHSLAPWVATSVRRILQETWDGDSDSLLQMESEDWRRAGLSRIDAERVVLKVETMFDPPLSAVDP